jgi:hypothetical protein
VALAWKAAVAPASLVPASWAAIRRSYAGGRAGSEVVGVVATEGLAAGLAILGPTRSESALGKMAAMAAVRTGGKMVAMAAVRTGGAAARPLRVSR